MLRENRGFAQSMDFPAQSNDRWFAQISMDCAILAQTMNALAMAFGYLIRLIHALLMNENSYIHVGMCMHALPLRRRIYSYLRVAIYIVNSVSSSVRRGRWCEHENQH